MTDIDDISDKFERALSKIEASLPPDDERNFARNIRLRCLDLVIGLHKTGAATGIKSIDVVNVVSEFAEFVLSGKTDE